MSAHLSAKVDLTGDADTLLLALGTALNRSPHPLKPACVWALRTTRIRPHALRPTWQSGATVADLPVASTVLVLLDGAGNWCPADRRALDRLCNRIEEHARTGAATDTSVIGIGSPRFDSADIAAAVLAYLEHPVRLSGSITLDAGDISPDGIRAAVLAEMF